MLNNCSLMWAFDIVFMSENKSWALAQSWLNPIFFNIGVWAFVWMLRRGYLRLIHFSQGVCVKKGENLGLYSAFFQPRKNITLILARRRFFTSALCKFMPSVSFMPSLMHWKTGKKEKSKKDTGGGPFSIFSYEYVIKVKTLTDCVRSGGSRLNCNSDWGT